MTRATTDEITLTDGRFIGPVRKPVNQAQGVRGSIHNDAVASKLGFKGGTVAGSVHLELFPPLLHRAFGDSWFERGTLSMNFRNATTDREPVRASVGQPPEPNNSQVEIAIHTTEDLLVGEGTASAGVVDEPSALLAMDITKFEAGELRILDGVAAGDEIPEVTVDMPTDFQDSRLNVMTEVLDWYTGSSPWGGPVASPETVVHYLYAHPARSVGRNAGRAVGLFGAIELRNCDGPLTLGRSYTVGGNVVAVGQSPRTEYVWFECYAAREDGTHVAEMRMQLRWMKDSSPLYTS